MKKFSFLVVLFLTILSSSAQTAALDATFNAIDLGFGNGDGANNDVNCLAVQADGKILIAGSFTNYNGTSTNSITRLNADGSQDSSFDVGSGANNSVNSLALQSDGKIIIAGIFTSFDGISINRIARLNTDGSLDTSFNVGTGASAVIFSVTVQSDDKILIGGNFTTYNGVARARMTRLNADGTLDSSFSIGSGFNGFVNTIILQTDGKIIVGGNFTTYNGSSRIRITRLESSGSLDTGFSVSSGANGVVNSIAVLSDGKIIIGGNFTSYNGTSINRIAKLNANGSLDSGFNVGTGADDAVLSVAIQSDGSILVGGAFTEIDTVSRNRMARLEADGSLDTGFVVGSGFDYQVRAIRLQADGKILTVGYFTIYNDNSKNYIARLESNGSLDSEFAMGTGANNEVFALAIQPDGKILIGGTFTSYNNISRNYIARLHVDGTLDTTFDVGTGADNTVHSVVVQSDGKILIGGYFTSFNGTSVSNIARLNSDGSLDTTFNTGTGANGIVYSIAIQQDGKILIGGEFTAFNEISMNNIVRLNVDGSLDASFVIGTGADWYINSLKIQSDNKILIGGGFTNYNDISRNYIARLNSDGSLDTDFNIGTGADSDITAIAVQSNGKVLIGGYFTNYDDASRNHIARLNTNGSLDTDFVVGSAANSEVFSLALQEDNRVLIGGSFSSFNGIPVNRIVRLNVDGSLDTNFTVGTGVNNQINTLHFQSDGKIIVGGQFTAYNNIGRNRIARINGFTSPPTALSQTFCGFAYVENLVASGISLKWYLTATSSNALDQTDLVTSGTYYVSQTVNTIESERVPVSIIVSSNVIPVFTQVEPISQGGALLPLPTISNNGIQGTWSPELNTLETTTYTFVSNDSCATSATMTIIVNASSPVFTQVDTICSGEVLNALPTTSNNGIEGIWTPELNNMETTTYTFTPNSEGISTVTMTIVVNPSSINTTTVSNCDSYFWENNGETYTTSGTYSGTTTNCVTEKLELTINTSTSNTTVVNACESFTWDTVTGNGLTYTSSQTGITSVSTNGVGCPHIETLNLTITLKPNAPENLACYETAEFNTQTCQWNIVGEQPAKPTELACYQSVGTFNIQTCQWNIVGEQPTQPTELACYQSVGTFNSDSCQWNIVGEQPVQPTELACYQSVGTFNTQTCQWNIVGEQPAKPTELACYQSVGTFNSDTCQWNIIGEQPVQPTELACYQSVGTFNSDTCQWNIVGEQPVQPTELACYESVGTFNTQTCQWNIVGEQPMQPLQVNCWDNFVFNSENCLWVNEGTAPPVPSVTANQTFLPGSTVVNLQAIGTDLKWYTQASGGIVLLSSAALVTGTYYVTQTINGCESQRSSVRVTLTTLMCSGVMVSDLLVIGGIDIKWYTSLTSSSVLSPTTTLSTRTYFYTQTIFGNTSPRSAVSVVIDASSNASSISGASGTICYNSGKILSLNTSTLRGTIQWQSSVTENGNFTPISGATGTTLNTGNLTTTTYFNAVVTNGVCPSRTTATAIVAVNQQSVAGTISGNSASICPGSNSTLLTSNGRVGSIQWHSSTDNINFVSLAPNGVFATFTASNLTATTYYRAVVTNGIGCTPAISASFAVNVKPVVNAGIITGPLSVTTNNTATMVLTGFTSGATLAWRQSSTLSGTYILGTQPILVQGSYTTAKLSKDAFYRVVVTKDGCSSTSPTFFIDVVPAKINAPEDTFEVIAYPNPSSDEFTIEASSKGATIRVYDVVGRLIENRQINTNSVQVGKNYATGVYNVIVNQGTKVKTLRVIKR